MKILHTGDWHIGKLVHGRHMTEDQRHMLRQLIDLLVEEQVDVLVIAGDVYDRSIPPTDAVELLDEVLSEIVMTHGIKVIAVSGNHDSPDRLEFGSNILKDKGLHIIGRLSKQVAPITVADDYGCVHFYPIPYAEPAIVRALYDNEACKNHDNAIETIMSTIKETMNDEERNVCIGHAFVMGTETLETSDSERPLSIGGSEYVDVNHYESFDYTALGHLHRPQKVKHDHIRYSGSLLKYSFSEAIQKKSVTLIDLREKGVIDIQQRVLAPLRDMRIIEGSLEELLDPAVYSFANTEDYINAVLTDRGALFEPVRQLRIVYPNILQLERSKTLTVDEDEVVVTSEDLRNRDVAELFSEFFQSVTGDETTEEEMHLFAEVVSQVEKEERSK